MKSALLLYYLFYRTSYPVYAETALALVHFEGGGGVVGVFPRGSCYKGAKEIQSPHPGLKIGSKSHQVLRHARVCPRGQPPGMVADKCMKGLWMGTPCWCPSEGHRHGGRK